MEGLTDLLTPWCVHTAATLGVAERLPADIGVMAGELDCDREALHELRLVGVARHALALAIPGVELSGSRP